MKYKCVVVDLDQTLLHEDKSLSRETIEVFAQLPPETEIVVATGGQSHGRSAMPISSTRVP